MGVLLTGRGGSAGLLLFVGLAGVVAWCTPDGALASLPPLCPSKWLAAGRCPTCGTTRALQQIVHGNLTQAWHLNPVAFVVVAGVLRACWLRYRSENLIGRMMAHTAVDGLLLLAFFALGYLNFFGLV